MNASLPDPISFSFPLLGWLHRFFWSYENCFFSPSDALSLRRGASPGRRCGKQPPFFSSCPFPPPLFFLIKNAGRLSAFRCPLLLSFYPSPSVLAHLPSEASRPLGNDFSELFSIFVYVLFSSRTAFLMLPRFFPRWCPSLSPLAKASSPRQAGPSGDECRGDPHSPGVFPFGVLPPGLVSLALFLSHSMLRLPHFLQREEGMTGFPPDLPSPLLPKWKNLVSLSSLPPSVVCSFSFFLPIGSPPPLLGIDSCLSVLCARRGHPPLLLCHLRQIPAFVFQKRRLAR